MTPRVGMSMNIVRVTTAIRYGVRRVCRIVRMAKHEIHPVCAKKQRHKINKIHPRYILIPTYRRAFLI